MRIVYCFDNSDMRIYETYIDDLIMHTLTLMYRELYMM